MGDTFSSPELTPMNPSIIDRGGLNGFVAIEEGVRVALPSAPRLLQLLVAGATLSLGNGDPFTARRIAKYEVEEGEDLLLARYSTHTPTPYTAIMALRDDLGSGESARTSYWQELRPYTRMLLENQPGFMAQIIGSLDEDPTNLFQTVNAEPVRIPEIFPKSPLTKSQDLDALTRISQTRAEFWGTIAEVDVWDQAAEQVQNSMDGGVISVTSAPRGSGKSSQLLPRLAEIAKKNGREPIYLHYTDTKTLQNSLALFSDGTAVTLLLDEPQVSLNEWLKTSSYIQRVIREGGDVQVAVTVGGKDRREARTKAAEQCIVEPLKARGFAVEYTELDILPQLTKGSIEKFAEHVGMDEELTELLTGEPAFRHPRFFDATVFGFSRCEFSGIVGPAADIIIEDARAYHTRLRNEDRPSLPYEIPRTLRVMRDKLTSLSLESRTRRADGDLVIDQLATNTNLTDGAAYDHYVSLCKYLDVTPVAITTIQPRAFFIG